MTRLRSDRAGRVFAAGLLAATVLLSSCSDGDASASELCDSLDAVNVALAKLQTASSDEASAGLPQAVIELQTSTQALIEQAPDSASKEAKAVEDSAATLREDTRKFIGDLERSIGIRIASKYQPNVASLGREDVIQLQDQVANVLSDADHLGEAMESLTGAVGAECKPAPAES
jgi:hypothetical protein